MSFISKKKSSYGKNLTQLEIKSYEDMGTIHYGDDFLELFTDDVIDKLREIKNLREEDGGNQQKADVLAEYLKPFGFVEVDLGTNIMVHAHMKYPGVVFKFALDDFGVSDNFNDEFLGEYIPELTRVIALHPTGLVSVQERKVCFRSRDRIRVFHNEIREILERISKTFVLVDLSLSPRVLRNFCINRDGSVGIVDASDIFPIPKSYNIFQCQNVICKNGKQKKCKGHLQYDELFYELVCPVCHARYNPLTLRKSKKEVLRLPSISLGVSADDLSKLNRLTYKIRTGELTDPNDLAADPVNTDPLEYEIPEDDDKDETPETHDVYDADDDDVESFKDMFREGPTAEAEPEDDEDDRVIKLSLDSPDDAENGIVFEVSSSIPESDFVQAFSEHGPDIFMKTQSGACIKVVKSSVLAAIIDKNIQDLKEDGLWE